MADDRKTYTGGRFTFELDDRKSAGFVNSIDGGAFKADVVQYQQGGDGYVSRYAGRAKYDDITVTVGAAMSPAFWKWVESSLARKPQRRNGALVGYDFDFKERSRRSFFGALIAEIGFPGCDATAKNASTLSIKITPEEIKYQKGDGHALTDSQAQDQVTKQKRWLSSNFKFSLDRFPDPNAMRAVKVDGFTVKQNVMDNAVGNETHARKEAGRLELPPIVVTFPEYQMKDWMDWWDKSVGLGDRKDQYTTGVLTYLASDTRSELMHIEFAGVSLASVELDKSEAHKEGIATAKATLNIEGLTLVTGAGTV